MFCLQLALIMQKLIMLFSLSKTENDLFLLSLCEQKTIENYQNFLVQELNDQFIGMNINQKVRIKLQQINIDIFSNQILLELIDSLF